MALASADFRLRSAEFKRALFLLACLVFGGLANAQNADQSTLDAGNASSLRTPNSAFRTTRWGRKLAALDNRATPLFWANGITRIDELEEYKRVGLNTVVVRLGWRPSPDGALVPEDLQPQRRFAEEVARRGLFVIYSLPPAPFGMESGFRVSAGSEAYFLMWSAWTQNAIALLKDTPNLLGWMLPDDPRSLPFADDVGWNRWLHENFASVAVVNGQWGAAFDNLDDVSLEATRGVIKAWRGGAPTGGMSIEELSVRMAQNNRRPADQNFAFHPAALAMARFRWDSFSALLQAWAQVVREADASHLVCTGRLPDYAQLLGVPANIDVSIPDIRPGVAEADVLTHNPQAVDIARRGNRFLAIPTLSTSGTAAVDGGLLPSLLPKWADSAFAHGASGLAFDQWADLFNNEDLRRSVQSTLARLQTPAFAPLWQQPPVASAAIVLTPMADGHTLQTGTTLTAEARGLYGFGDDLVAGEPSDLVFALRWGTAFGSFDYLAPEDVAADAAALRRYNLILMPQALSVDVGEAAALQNYMEAGGVVVADLGLGAWQAGARANFLPPYLARLFGVPTAMPMRAVSFNLQWLAPHELWPTWSQNPRRGGIVTAGDGPGGAAFAGPAGYGDPQGGAAVGLGHQILEQLPRNHNGVAPTRLQRSFLSAQPVGNGFAVFAPWRLWTFWRPGQNGFDAFHGDLLARGATLAQSGAPALVPAPPAASSPLYSQVVNMPNAIALLNHTLTPAGASDFSGETAVSNPTVGAQSTLSGALGSSPNAPPNAATPKPSRRNLHLAQIQTSGVGDFLWSGGVATFGNGAPETIIGGRPAPIADPDEWESRAQPIVLHALVAGGEAKVLQVRRVRAQNMAGGPLSGSVLQDEAAAMRLILWPNSVGVTVQNNDFSVFLAEAAPVRVTVYDDPDGYAIAPNSRHRVAITDLAASAALIAGNARNAPKKRSTSSPRTTFQIVTADAKGQIKVETSGAAISIEIAPQT